jgi:hypothetical protein
MPLPVEAHQSEGELDDLAHQVGLAGDDTLVIRRVFLEHPPRRLDVLRGTPQSSRA